MVYRILQNDKGLVVVKGEKIVRTSVKHYKGRFDEFSDVERFFREHYRGMCVPLQTNFNSGERISLLEILWQRNPSVLETPQELVW